MSTNTQNKNPERVAAGLKGTLKNPNVSEEAKERASDRLQKLGVNDRDRTKNTESKSVPVGDVVVVDDAKVNDGGDGDFESMNVLGHEDEDDEYEYKPPNSEDVDEL